MLFEHPEVVDVAVIGVPHQVLGEEVGAVDRARARARRSPPTTCARTWRARLAAFKVPAHVYFRDEPLPRNPAGKVLKRELRDELVG